MALAQTIEISATRGVSSFRLGEVWACRELLWFLVWRDISVRYKQTVLGMTWAIVQPLTATIIFSLVFGRLARLPSDGVPYPLFAYTGLIAWNLVSSGVARASASLVSNASLITKVYFPRLLVPIAAALGGTADFAVSFVFLAGMMAYFGVAPGLPILALPVFVLFALVTTLGIGFWLAALNAQYRDIGHVTPFLIQVWLYASPVAYSSHLIPSQWRMLYALNPVSGVVAGFRWSLLGGTLELTSIVLPSAATALVLLVTGAMYFRWRERTVADVI